MEAYSPPVRVPPHLPNDASRDCRAQENVLPLSPCIRAFPCRPSSAHQRQSLSPCPRRRCLAMAKPSDLGSGHKRKSDLLAEFAADGPTVLAFCLCPLDCRNG